MSDIKITHASLTDIGNVRRANEDSLGSLEGPYGPIFTVCDGMGGHVGGATASRIAVATILEFISTSTVENPSVTINNALISANQKILQTAYANPDLKGMGTTATVLIVQPKGLYIGHVGDSRIYILSENQLHRLTKDDSLVQTLVDSGAITDEEAENHPRKNELLKALGVIDSIQPTIINKPIKPKRGDVLLLCSDGLCGLVNDLKMQHILVFTEDLPAAAEQLVNAAKNAGGDDNITVQLVRIIESPYQASEFNSYSQRPSISEPAPATFENTAATPAQQHKLPKPTPLVKRLRIPIIGAMIIVGWMAFAYVTKSWPFTDKSVIPAVDNIDGYDIPGENGFLTGDTIIGEYLVHKITDKDTTLEQVVGARKKQKKDPYRQYMYDTTYSIGNIPVDNESFSDVKRVKWKNKQEAAEVNQTVPITLNTDKEPEEPEPGPTRNDTGSVKKNKGISIDTAKVIADLQRKLDTANQKFIVTQRTLQEAEATFKKADSIVKANNDKSKKKQLEGDRKNAKAARDAAASTHKIKKGQITNLSDQIKALKPKADNEEALEKN